MATDQPQRDNQRIAALDGFRGLAILMVTFYRFAHESLTSDVVGKLPSQAIQVGAAGVDLFFVLSGFLITGILVDSKPRSSGYFTRFYIRRSLRILPLYFAALMVFLVLMPYLLDNQSISQSITLSQAWLWSYTSNLRAAFNERGGFGYLEHFWSLGIEEQFYLLWPPVVFFTPQSRLVKVIVAGILLSCTSRVFSSCLGVGESMERYLTPFRLDGLLLGALAAIFVRSPQWQNFRAWRAVAILMLAILGWAATLPSGSNDLTLRYTLVSIIGFATILLLLQDGEQNWLQKLFSLTPLCSLGKYSYGMYVFQLPLVGLLGGTFDPPTVRHAVGQPVVAGVLYVVVMFTVTYLLAVASWHLFEKWILRLRPAG